MSILDGSNGFVVEGHTAQDDLGYSIKGAGVVNLELQECSTPLFMENVTGTNGFALRAPYGEGAFSGDGKYDFWEIKGYDNISNFFDGKANRWTALGAGDLPSGTYFFKIHINGQHLLRKTEGYIVLKDRI